ncbi:chemotaxis protein CheW [Paenibacillus sp. JX-17]|uniref:Chemotaxis protein CheW n=1 Tax=Paenibacillus lacisoli TaxID=3064525 RepID=A0ABT9C8M1_9BACL|nr:chemotaxis protein CheW [Paenibacillus sp. JX-17]MDO7905612.1 chemotaxis protein CheW [Paenibacillus sp. JX-17]
MNQYVIFNLGSTPCAISFSEVEEIMAAKKGTPLPFAEPWHEGVITVRGELYTVMNLTKRFNLSSQSAEPDKMVLLRREKIALLVDELRDTASVEDNDILDNDDSRLKEFFPHVFVHGPQSVCILETESLLESGN